MHIWYAKSCCRKNQLLPIGFDSKGEQKNRMNPYTHTHTRARTRRSIFYVAEKLWRFKCDSSHCVSICLCDTHTKSAGFAFSCLCAFGFASRSKLMYEWRHTLPSPNAIRTNFSLSICLRHSFRAYGRTQYYTSYNKMLYWFVRNTLYFIVVWRPRAIFNFIRYCKAP